MNIYGQQVDLATLAQDAGIHFPNEMVYLKPEWKSNFSLAMDAQPTMITATNAGIPAYLANYLDPKIIEVIVAPMKAAVILGEGNEQKKGDWTTASTQFIVVEYEGETSAYGDHNNNGQVDANTNFISRESFHYQTFTEWGEKELETAALAKIDLASRKNLASILVLNKFQNQSYFFGIDGIKNYGLLNDPNLLPAIAPLQQWGLSTTDGAEIFEDIRRLFKQLQTQANGTVTHEDKMVLALSPTIETELLKINTYNVSVIDQIKKQFPNTRIETAPEYTTAAGELMQLIVEEVDAQPTAITAFTEKMRAHQIIPAASSWRQKKSQGTWGAIIFRPVYIASMIGL